jgi:Methyltransferase domain
MHSKSSTFIKQFGSARKKKAPTREQQETKLLSTRFRIHQVSSSLSTVLLPTNLRLPHPALQQLGNYPQRRTSRGIASQELATKFQTIIVSDPNDGYANIAAKRITKAFGLAEKMFRFLQESAEKSFVGDASVDLLVICEAIHWTDIPRAMEEFARQLKKGGTIAIQCVWKPQDTW